jgi:hypothetical protein
VIMQKNMESFKRELISRLGLTPWAKSGHGPSLFPLQVERRLNETFGLGTPWKVREEESRLSPIRIPVAGEVDSRG